MIFPHSNELRGSNLKVRMMLKCFPVLERSMVCFMTSTLILGTFYPSFRGIGDIKLHDTRSRSRAVDYGM